MRRCFASGDTGSATSISRVLPWATVALTLLVRVVYASYITFGLQLVERYDSAWYHRAASMLADGRGLPLTGHWMPGYPALLSVFYLVFGPSLFVARLVNALLATATAALLVAWTQRFMGWQAAALAGLVYAVFPTAIFYSGGLYCEDLHTPIVMGLLLLLPSSLSGFTTWKAVALGSLFGIGLLTRPETAVFMGLALAWLCWAAEPGQRRHAIVSAGLSLIVAIAILSPWIVRNYRVFGRFVPLTTSSGGALLEGNNALATGGSIYERVDGVPLADRVYPPGYDGLAGVREPERSRWAQQLALGWIEAHPFGFVKLLGLKAREFWHLATPYLFRNSTPHVVIERWLPVAYLALLILAGWIGFWHFPGGPAKQAFGLLFLAAQLVTLLFYALDRYRLSFLVVWISFAAYAVTDFPQIARRLRPSQPGWWRAPLALSLIGAIIASRWIDLAFEYVPRLKTWL